MMRTHTCGALRAEHVGERVALCGWVSTVREHGQLNFVALRDRYGMTQVIVSADKAAQLNREDVIRVEGEVRTRPEGTERDDLATGAIEVVADGVEVLGPCETPPFEVRESTKASADLRLKYRYLDLRRPSMLSRMLARHQTVRSIRATLEGRDFVEVEPPMFVKPTPEGSRDFIVPSRRFSGRAYALPQSPQLYKQILMIAGLDRYYSMPRCFRDEDPRRERQLVHTQVDLEMSFVEESDVFAAVEALLTTAFRDVGGVELPPFERYTYDEVMARWGIDKPDLRFGMELCDLSDLAAQTEMRVFKGAVEAGGQVKGIVAPGIGSYSRKQRGELETFVKAYGLGGLAWLKRDGDGFKASFERMATPEQLAAMAERAGVGADDLLLVAADKKPASVARGLGELRSMLGDKLELIPDGVFKPLWVTDFPLFEIDEATGEWAPMHHMFTEPRAEFADDFEQRPAEARGHLYDVVINGVELGSGSVRITRPDLQQRVMDFVGYPREQAEENFGFFLRAFRYGAPPHAGLALGLDNLVMVMLGLSNIQDVIAFPNNSSGVFPLDGSPSDVETATWTEYDLAHVKPVTVDKETSRDDPTE